jgi:hypothetical protein
MLIYVSNKIKRHLFSNLLKNMTMLFETFSKLKWNAMSVWQTPDKSHGKRKLTEKIIVSFVTIPVGRRQLNECRRGQVGQWKCLVTIILRCRLEILMASSLLSKCIQIFFFEQLNKIWEWKYTRMDPVRNVFTQLKEQLLYFSHTKINYYSTTVSYVARGSVDDWDDML